MRTDAARGFDYPLEPVRRQREWKLAAAQAQAARLRAQLEELQARRSELLVQCTREAARAATLWAAVRDPVAHARCLSFLSSLQQAQSGLACEVAQLGDRLADARRECIRRNRLLEVLDRHRAEAVVRFHAEAASQHARQADQDWSARSARAGPAHRNHMGENE